MKRASHRLAVALGSSALFAGVVFAGMFVPSSGRAGSGAEEDESPRDEGPRLEFVDSGSQGDVRALSLAALRAACGEREVEVDDPYHERRMRYRTLPFVCVLEQGFAARGGVASLAGQKLLLRARDGYTRPAEASLVASDSAHLAFGEAGADERPGDPPRFSPIDRREVDPAPFYLVWSGLDRGDPHDHPWPYQLVRIEIAAFEAAFPHTVPRGLPRSDPGWQGYALFQSACSACHAINGEGGKVGPELNVPKNIVEYRPRTQIRAYIRDPQATRYTSMPAHPQFGEVELDALLAYFEAMRTRKHDPASGARP